MTYIFIVKMKIIIVITFTFYFINKIINVDKMKNLINNRQIYNDFIIVNITIN